MDVAFAQRLKKALASKGLTQIEAANLLSINKDSVSNYMKGRLPKTDILLKLALLCNVSCDWLLTGIGYGPEDPENNINLNFVDRLNKSMSTSGVTKEQLLIKANISEDKLEDYLAGTVPSSLDLLKLAQVFGVSMEWLLTGEEHFELKETEDSRQLYIKGIKDALEMISTGFSKSIEYAILQLK